MRFGTFTARFTFSRHTRRSDRWAVLRLIRERTPEHPWSTQTFLTKFPPDVCNFIFSSSFSLFSFFISRTDWPPLALPTALSRCLLIGSQTFCRSTLDMDVSTSMQSLYWRPWLTVHHTYFRMGQNDLTTAPTAQHLEYRSTPCSVCHSMRLGSALQQLPFPIKYFVIMILRRSFWVPCRHFACAQILFVRQLVSNMEQDCTISSTNVCAFWSQIAEDWVMTICTA